MAKLSQTFYKKTILLGILGLPVTFLAFAGPVSADWLSFFRGTPANDSCVRLLSRATPEDPLDRLMSLVGIRRSPPLFSLQQVMTDWAEKAKLVATDDQATAFMTEVRDLLRRTRLLARFKPTLRDLYQINDIVISIGRERIHNSGASRPYYDYLKLIIPAMTSRASTFEDYKLLFDFKFVGRSEYESIVFGAQNRITSEQPHNFDLARARAISRPYSIDNILNETNFSPEEKFILVKSSLENSQSFTTSWNLRELMQRAIQPNSDFDVESFIINRFPEDYLTWVIRDLKNGEMSVSQIKSHLSSIHARHPTLFQHESVDMAWDRVQRRDVGIWIFSQLTRRELQLNPPENSLQFVCEKLGIPYDLIKSRADRLSGDTMGDFYEGAMDLIITTPALPLSRLPIDRSVFSTKPNFKRFVEILLNLKMIYKLGPSNEDEWHAVISDFSRLVGGPLDGQNIDKAEEAIKQTLVASIKRMLGNEDLDFSYEELMKLQESWGSLEPVFNLIARFKGKLEWNVQLRVLSKIFQASLKGTFETYKFEGDKEDERDQQLARDQLAMLKTAEAKQAWRRPRHRATAASPQVSLQTSTPDDQLQNAKNQLVHTLIPNLGLREFKYELRIPASEWIRTFLFLKPPQVLVRLRQSDDIVSVDGVAPTHSSRLQVFLRLLLNELISTESLDVVKWGLDVITALAESFEIDGQGLADFKLLKNELRAQASTSGREIIFSTLSSAPKLLLTVGDLVKAASCQNYRTGGYIDTLPGYVIDAGVQVVASFAIEPKDFYSTEEFNQVFSALKTRNSVSYSFDGNLKIVSFHLTSWQTVQTRSLGYAFLRKMLKLGKTADGRAGVVYEVPYQQTHTFSPLMNQHHQELLEEVAAAISGTFHESITIPQSRNTRGVYSDRAGGIQQSSYTIRSDTRMDQ